MSSSVSLTMVAKNCQAGAVTIKLALAPFSEQGVSLCLWASANLDVPMLEGPPVKDVSRGRRPSQRSWAYRYVEAVMACRLCMLFTPADKTLRTTVKLEVGLPKISSWAEETYR